MSVRGSARPPGRRRKRAAAGLFFALIALAAPSQGFAQDESQGAADAITRESLVVATAGGARHTFFVEIADEAGERAKGLMFRPHLAPDSGMLFRFPTESHVAFWMKNTLVSLDILFLRRDGRIARIAKETTPLSLDPIRSGEPVLAVLEVVAGTADRLGLQVGDRVEHALLEAR